jgi:GNAT superfamily N-acetyltransferase
MRLETERLWIIPLTAEQLALWVHDIPALERELDGSYQGEALEGGFLEIVEGQVEKAAGAGDGYLYHTFWLLVRKADRTAVGSACFKGAPDEKDEVEIGYGLGKAFEGQGYMTEAVRALCDWALRQESVSWVTAETEADHQASQSVLKRCGFTLYHQGETWWWRVGGPLS